jgi:hypothetical protein
MSDIAPLHIPFLELQRHHCREVTGTGDDGLALCCGRPRSGRSSYCLHHRRINLVMVQMLQARRKGAGVNHLANNAVRTAP